jgi:UrcA family protein
MRLGWIAAAAMLAGGAAPLAAQDWRDREWQQVRVDASALDLSTAAGVDELERRVARAVNRICGSDPQCRDEAWASTDEQVAWAIRHDELVRHYGEARLAELAACGEAGCRPAAPPRRHPSGGTVTVTILY